jgi:hypothetical protein
MRQSTTACLGCCWFFASFAIVGCSRNQETFTTEESDYHAPPPEQDKSLADDQLDEKRLPSFDPKLIDSRPLGEWEVNASAAVVGLDCPIIKPDSESGMLVLRKSYADAIANAPILSMLPSANLIDGAAKQFDDGLYAALDLACYRGELGFGASAPEVVQRAFDKLRPASRARPYLAAALALAGKSVSLSATEEARKKALLDEFAADQARSKPVGFYVWTPELTKIWRFYRFLQKEFTDDDIAVVAPIAGAFNGDPQALTQYRTINGFYERLTNPRNCLAVDSLLAGSGSISARAKAAGVRHEAVAFFPPSTSRHAELFEELFPLGLPAGSDLMRTLVQKIRSGEVNLKPGENDGWFQYQVYALETLLLPSRGQERDKLLLSASYKKRLVEAFKAIVTKRIETHVRQLDIGAYKSEVGPRPIDELKAVKPRLRIEPSPTFYLRTARAYAFLKNFLTATIGRERLAKLHGLRETGPRGIALSDELDQMRDRFYGFYLISCEDIGLPPELMPDEHVDSAAATKVALQWLNDSQRDPDLALDTRVAVPIYIDYQSGKTRLWATLGVRLAPLAARYAAPPKIRVAGSSNPWQDVKPETPRPANYVIPVDEFAEFDLDGSRVLNRDELRALCDKYKTKEEILKALSAEQQ